jgi:hypothetical protein
MDNLDDILRRVAAGEITPDQAEQQILAAPKPRRGAPRKPKRQIRVAGRIIEIKPPRYKPTHHNMEIGRRYVELTGAGKKSHHAIAIIQRSTKNRKVEPLGESVILKYAALYRLECWKRDLEARHQKEFGKPVNANESVHDMLEVMKAFGIRVDKDMVRIIS